MMLDDFYPRGDDFKLPPDIMSHPMQRPAAFRTDSFRFGQYVLRHFYRQTGQIVLAFTDALAASTHLSASRRTDHLAYWRSNKDSKFDPLSFRLFFA